jgi:hypothetical protein
VMQTRASDGTSPTPAAIRLAGLFLQVPVIPLRHLLREPFVRGLCGLDHFRELGAGVGSGSLTIAVLELDERVLRKLRRKPGGDVHNN